MASSSTSREPKDKKVVLFGQTGAGKSTIANVLVAGGLQPVIFASSDAAKGCTRAIQKESGRGWIVTDTVGLGAEIISHTEAKNTEIELLKEVGDEFSHIIYVQKARRFTSMEELTWGIFAQLFEGAEDAFVILITAADTGWLDENWDKFPECWKKHNILATNIPHIHKRPSIEKRFKVIREKSIAQLEKDLENLFQERGNKYYTPAIAKMNETQLEAKSWSFYDYMVSQIRRLYRNSSWQKAAAQLSNFLYVFRESRDLYSSQFLIAHRLFPAGILLESLRKSYEGVLETDLGSVMKTAPYPSRAFFIEAFIGEVIEGNQDGYFVSSEWLLSLVDNERDSLMSCLQTAGYSETCQTITTILFARINNNTSRKTAAEFVCPGDIDEVATPKGGNDQFEIDLNTEKFVGGADVLGSNNLLERSSSIDHGRNLLHSSPIEQQDANRVLESFKAILKSRSQQSFCVSMKWLSKLEDHDKETLRTQLREARYEKSCQTTSSIWYKRTQDCAGIEGGGACDIDMSSSSNRNNVLRNQVQQSTSSELLGFFKRMVGLGDDASGSSGLTVALETDEIQDDDSGCHSQLLTVSCSSSTCQTPGELVQYGNFYRQEFGGSVGNWPVSKSEVISSTVERSFRIPTLDFLTNQGGTEVPTEVLMNLQAFATISLSCCLRIGHQPPKIRLKFSRISAEIKNKETEEENEELQEEFCNKVVLSYLCTNVYSCTYSGDSGCGSDQIILHLEDEYSNPPGRRVVANDQHSWLEKSGVTPMNCEPGSTSVVLRCDIEKRSLHDLGIPRPLHFQETRPLILEGGLNSSRTLLSYIEFRIRHKLVVSYFRPSRPFLGPGPVWIAESATKEVDFCCCLEVRADNIIKRTI